MTQPGIEPMIVSRADLARRLTERYGQVTITDLSNWTRAADLHSVLRPTGDPSERTFTLYQVGILTRMARAIRRWRFSPVEAFRLATLTRSSYEQYFLFSELDLKRSEGPYSLMSLAREVFKMAGGEDEVQYVFETFGGPNDAIALVLTPNEYGVQDIAGDALAKLNEKHVTTRISTARVELAVGGAHLSMEGTMVHAFILAKQTEDSGEPRELLERLSRISKVRNVYSVFGDMNLIIEVVADDTADLARVVIQDIRRVGHIRFTQTYITAPNWRS